MSFGDHLDELRKRILFAILPPLPLAVVIFFFSPTIIDLLLRPLYRVLGEAGLPQQVQALGPPEVVVTQLKLSLIAALIFSGPWLLWQAWLFISPGLYTHERRFVHWLLPGSAILTVAGVALMYFAMLPLMLRVLVMFGSSLNLTPPEITTDAVPAPIVAPAAGVPAVTADPPDPEPGQIWIKLPEAVLRIAVIPDAETGEIVTYQIAMTAGTMVSQQYRMSEYINFVLLLFLAIAIAFQMPLVILLLGWLGLASVEWLASRRRYALLVCGVLAAVITPADVVSMVVMLIPLYALYEFGILLLRIAPASKVAEGRVFSFGGARGTSGKSRPADSRASSQSDPPAQTTGEDQTDPKGPPPGTIGQPRRETPDDETGEDA